MTNAQRRAPEGVATNVRHLIAGTEELLGTIRKSGSDQYNEAIERIEGELARIKADLDDIQGTVAARTRAMARRTDRIVRAHPWETAGTGVGVGLLLGTALGILIARALDSR